MALVAVSSFFYYLCTPQAVAPSSPSCSPNAKKARRHASKRIIAMADGHQSASFLLQGSASALFCLGFSLAVAPPYFHQKIVPKRSTRRLIQAMTIHWPHEMLISLFPCSHSSHTSRNRLGSSVITPSTSLLILHRIMSSSLTVHTYSGLPFAFTSRIKRAPKNGTMRVFCNILKETLGTERNLRAYGMEKPMCVMGKVGRYSAQRGRNLTAQHPRTRRWFQGLRGLGGTD